MGTDELTLDKAIDSDVLAPGSKLLSGQYEILRYLSSGGFGITYLAKDSLNRTVVIKECFPEAFCSRVNKTVRARSHNRADDFRSIVQLFIKEAHALSRLQHPSVVGVHQVFEDNETAYMALDLVDGQDLFDTIDANTPKLSPQALHEITLKLLDAVGHVHSQDLLHRDISPDNILLDKSGHPVLIDFGAAREEASRKSRVLSSVLVVKDGYSPPEFYVAGSQQLPCSDLYALAATLAHVITGEAPPNSQMRLAALASNEADPYEPLKGRFPQYDQAFLAAIDDAINIVPANRIQSAEEWVLKIDHSKRLELARKRAQSDASIDQTVTKLLRMAHEEAETAATGPGADAKAPDKQDRAETDTAAALAHADPEGTDAGCDTSPGDGASEITAVVSGDHAELPEDPVEASSSVEVDENKTATVSALTPIERVRSKELDRTTGRAKSKGLIGALKARKPHAIRRLASVPIVFCAYFFYGSTVFQQDVVHAATIEPLAAFSAEISEELLGLRELQPVTEAGSGVIRRVFGD